MRHIGFCIALVVASPFASSIAAAGCMPIMGNVKLTPDAACTVTTFPGLQGQPFVGECYKFTLKLAGVLPVYGYSGVTAEAMSGIYTGDATSSPASVQENRMLLTARSTLVMAGTRLYAAEVIISSNGDLVTEQSVITGTDGKGQLKNASGGFAILGNSVGQTAQVIGKICTP